MVFNRKRCAAVISAAVFALNISSAFAAWDGYIGEDETTVPLVDFNNIFDVRATKGSAEQVHTLDKKLYSIGWQNMSSPNALYLANIPSDWSEFERLDFMIYSEKATADNQMVVLVETERGTDNVWRYCYTKVDLNWEGWKNVSISLADMTRTREPDMSKVTQVRLTTNGWETNPNGCEASIYIARATVGKSDGTSLRTLYDAETIEKAYAAIEGGAAVYAVSSGVVTTGGEVPFGRCNSIEPMYLLGNFAVDLRDGTAYLKDAPAMLEFGSIVGQGFPFYGGNVTYELKITLEKAGTAEIITPCYRGALVKVTADGEPAGNIVYAPYSLRAELAAGEHTIGLTVYGNRHNTFGSLHNCSGDIYYGPGHWRAEGDSWTYEYMLKDTGLLAPPIIYMEQD